MPSPKTGTEVTPEAPEEPHAADKADPGEMAKIKSDEAKTGKGKYGSTEVDDADDSGSDEGKDEEPKKTWFEFQVLDAAGKAVKGEPCKITLPDKTEKTLKTKSNGTVRIDDVEPGTVSIQLTDREDIEWKCLRVEESK